jgi:hypothetical protein
MDRIVVWQCPRCDHTNKTQANPSELVFRDICFCDDEEGGCGEMSAVLVRWEPFVEVYKMVGPFYNQAHNPEE